MTEEPNRPLTPSGDARTAPEMDRPAAGPDRVGEPSGTFPRDGVAESQAGERPHETGTGAPAAGVPQAVDPGLTDQPPGGPAPRPAWTQDGPREAGAAAGAGAAHQRAQEGMAGDHPYEPGAASGAPAGSVEPAPDRFRARWASVQGAFVDDPKASVGEADRLVGEAIQDLEQRLTRHREDMHGQWTNGDPDTEQLRRLLHGYRSFFHSVLESRL